MLAKEIRTEIIRPALKITGLWSDSAEMLVLGTGMVESNYTHLKQVSGPALGFWQCEPDTHTFQKKWLQRTDNVRLLASVKSASLMEILPGDDALIWNLRYAALMCRIRYLNAKPILPFWNDAVGMTEYHSQWYNRGGKANIENNTAIFKQLIDQERGE